MIGVIDSGIGGLSVLKELRCVMPHEDFIYLADTAHVPYGTRTDQEICALTEACVGAVHRLGARAVVVACNTASAFSLSHLRARYALPIVGLVPAVKPAALSTQTGVIGILATPATLRSESLQQTIDQWASHVQVLKVCSPQLVPLIERGEINSPAMLSLLHEILDPLVAANVDRLVLGCTHYPFLSDVLLGHFPFELVDSGAAVARHTADLVGHNKSTLGQVQYFATGDPQEAARRIEKLLGKQISVKHMDLSSGQIYQI